MAIGNNKLNNKGMSLVEILVTIAMVVIIAGPLINSFLNSRIVNSNARTIQNGTVVAQDIAEEFKAKTLEQLLVDYEGKYTLTDGVYKFTGITVTGANNETYTADVTLDPGIYTQGDVDDSGDRLTVNNVALPGMSSIYGSDVLKLYKYYVAADDNLKDLFSSLGDGVTQYIYGTHRQFVSKSTHINILWSYNSSLERFEYDITLNMMYKYQKDSRVKEVVHVEELKDIIMPAGQPNIMYLVCPVFDICSTDGLFGDIYYATDSINISCNPADATSTNKPDLYFYLAEQEAYHKIDTDRVSTKRQMISVDNVWIDGTPYISYDPDAQNQDIKFCSNISNPTNGNTLDLTYSENTSGMSMYEIKVDVKFKDKVVAEFKSSK